MWEQCPKACTNFLKLCKSKYYNYTQVPTIRKNQICYLGERDTKHGGSSSIWGLNNSSRRYFVPEIQESGSDISFKERGTVAFTTIHSLGKHGFKHEDLLADSQFCISLQEDLTEYDTEMAIFGSIAEGFDTLEKINDALTDVSGKPLKPILILHSHILEDPFEDIDGVNFPEVSPPPSPSQLDLISQIYDNNTDTEDREGDEEKKEKKKHDQEARAQALTLEIIGDLPFAEVRPEENILFVCKLNPVTQDEDLELIFSRFGKIISCEVIRDQDSGESLQYAFIEFDKQEDCERAYFKMEGVLIDDRRIHVDFSQSVSRLSSSWRKKSNANREAAHGKKFQRSSTLRSRSRSVSPRREDERENRGIRSNRDNRRHRVRDMEPRDRRERGNTRDGARSNIRDERRDGQRNERRNERWDERRDEPRDRRDDHPRDAGRSHRREERREEPRSRRHRDDESSHRSHRSHRDQKRDQDIHRSDRSHYSR